MDISEHLQGIRWQIISLLSKEDLAPTQLASFLHSSVPNISQHLKLMELMGVVFKKRQKTSNSNQVRVLYSLKMPFSFLVSCQFGSAQKKSISMGTFESFCVAVLGYGKKGLLEPFMKWYFAYDTFFSHIISLGIYKNVGQHIELLIISDTHLQEFRGKFAKFTCMVLGVEYTFTIWSHSREEFTKGVQEKQDYFLQFRTNGVTLLKDSNDFLKEVLEDKDV